MGDFKMGNNTVLTQSGTAKPTFGSGVPTGTVLRVLGDNYTGNLDLTTTYQDVPNLSINITLSSQTNKIAIMANLATYHLNTATSCAGILVRTIDGTTSLNYEVADYYNPSGSGISGNITIMYFDTPNTTSEINYKIQAKEELGQGLLNEDYNGTVNGVCSLMIQEIAG
tara:strand:+ start:538 stop:1044 length:507 start_codon:yes stop_codon:yes gene_type:complete